MMNHESYRKKQYEKLRACILERTLRETTAQSKASQNS